MTNPALPNYEGRVLSVSLKQEQGTVKIADPRWATVNGHLFLVGRWPDHPTEPQRFAGVQTAVRWDDVNHFILFDSEADFMRRLSDSGEVQRDPVVHIQ